jgi:hypothetical protein
MSIHAVHISSAREPVELKLVSDSANVECLAVYLSCDLILRPPVGGFKYNAIAEYNVDADTAEEGDAYFYGYYVDKTAKTLDIHVEDAIAYNNEKLIKDVEVSLPGYAKAQLYQFTSTGRTKELEIGGGVAGLTKFDDDDDTIKNYVLVRTVDGAIQEVIGFDFDVLVEE